MIYLFVNFTLLFFSFLKRDTFISVFGFLILLLFLGFGFANGADWINYYSNYECIQLGFCNNNALGFEIGYNALVRVFGGESYFFVVLICAVINIVSIFRFSLLFKRPYFFVFCIFSLYGWFLYVEQIRQSLALSCILIGVPFLYSKRYFWYFFTVLVAGFFHVSALFSIVFLLPSFYRKISVPLSVFLVCFFFILIMIIPFNLGLSIASIIPSNNFIYEKIIFYTTSDVYSPKLSFGVGSITDVLLIIIFFVSGLRRQHTYQDDLSFWGSFVFISVILAAKYQSVFVRLSYYAFPLLFVYLHGSLIAKKNTSLKVFIYLYFVAQIFRPLLHPVMLHDILNYKTVLYSLDISRQEYVKESTKQCLFYKSIGYGYLCGY